MCFTGEHTSGTLPESAALRKAEASDSSRLGTTTFYLVFAGYTRVANDRLSLPPLLTVTGEQHRTGIHRNQDRRLFRGWCGAPW